MSQLTCAVCGALLRNDSPGATVRLEPGHSAQKPSGATAPLPRAIKPDLKRTVIGLAPDPNLPAEKDSQGPRVGGVEDEAKRTLLGVSPYAGVVGASPPAEPDAAAPQRRAAHTMIGVAPAPGGAGGDIAAFLSPHPFAPSEPLAEASKAAQGMPAVQRAECPGASAVSTGTPVRPPPKGAPHDDPSGRAGANVQAITPRTLGASELGLPSARVQSQYKTKIGAGLALPPGGPAAVPMRTQSEAPTLVSAGPEEKRRRGANRRRVAWLAAVFVALAASAALLGLRSDPLLRASVELDETGRERIALECVECPDGTRASTGAATAVFEKGRATLDVPGALHVGQNKVELELQHLGGQREKIAIDVPLEVRLRGDLGGLSEQPPVIRVQVEAARDASVVVNGTSLAVDAHRTASLPVDVSRSLTGASASVAQVMHEIPYSVARPGTPPRSGKLRFVMKITPLSIASPGDMVIIDEANFTLAGQTAPGGAVTVGGRPITVDGSGRFAQLMNVSSTGETTITVRAVAPGHAPRLFPIRVRRVASLAQEARRLDPMARRWATFAAQPGLAHGTLVALEGVVLEYRAEPYTTSLLLDVTRDCAARPCLATLSYGSRFAAAPGDRLLVYGRWLGIAEGRRPGEKLPSIRADFLLRTDGK